MPHLQHPVLIFYIRTGQVSVGHPVSWGLYRAVTTTPQTLLMADILVVFCEYALCGGLLPWIYLWRFSGLGRMGILGRVTPGEVSCLW